MQVLRDSINILVQQFQNFVYESAGETIEDILETVHPITFSCYEGFFELAIIFQAYLLNLLTPRIVLFNSIHNFGVIYDTIVSIILGF